ncbi:MAG: hypothetical protein M3R72_01910 [Bacteroidota bacterium]|nr:hypothetical protein [Bacteroidota bacterium]
MLKNVVILFLVIYPLYVLFTREPDYFDGEFYRASIHYTYDSAQEAKVPFAVYSIERQTYSVPAGYLFRRLEEGEKVPLIYEAASPGKASLYSVWGYWIRWKELLSFLVLFIFFYFISVSITSNPTPETLLEELEANQPKPRRRKYD